ncbi:MAG TPA: DNA internalization-related competence protein ComEC/Rec2 [Myxococcota bacterium]|nr:DNA internalization-related competence protein ComEC/Rec2 [Myxococcota bacterium]
MLAALWALFPRSRTAEAALGGALGALALGLRLHAPVPTAEPGPVAVTLLEAPRASHGACRVTVWLHGARPGRALLLARGEACELLPGQQALARVRLEPLRPPSNPGASDSPRRLARRGVLRLARQSGEALAPIGLPPQGPAALLERARRHVAETLDPPALPTRAGALLRAMAVADTSRLDEPLRAAFSDSGTTHLLSVSGTHIVWVFWLTQICVTGLLGRLRALAWVRAARAAGMVAAAAAGLGYAALCGLEAPALRSAAMAAAGGIALLGGRRGLGWNALAAAALVVLAFDPGALFEASFQMSFAAVAGLLLWRAPAGALRGLAHASLAAGTITAPLAAGLGAPLPAGWLLANALAVPWFGAAVVPPALAAGLVPVLAPLARAAAELGVRGLELLATPDLLAGPRDRVARAALFAALAYGARGAAQRRRALCACSAAVAALSLWLAWPAENEPVDAPRLTFFDVGHGDAVLVRAGRHAWLVDTGTRAADFDAGRSVVVPGLRALGVRQLDALALTHADLDHVGGAPAVLAGVPVGELWLGRETHAAPALRPLRLAAARLGVRVRIIAAGDALGVSELALRVHWPPVEYLAPTTNAGSLVLQVGGPRACALLGGDAPGAVERALAGTLPQCDVLKLGHHGSATSSDPEWLDALEPVVAIASAGRRPRSPLPHPAVRARLGARAISLWETRRAGALDVELARPGPRVAPWLNPEWRDW